METAVAIPIKQDSPQAMMMAAIDKGMDLDKLEKFMILQERYEANQARKAYSQAMSDFKANPPEIEKDKDVSYGTTKYSHASLGNVTTKIGSALSKHGLSAAWKTQQTDKGVTVTCRISHVLGHYEETSLTAAADTSGAKNAIQSLGSTITYLERYTILALTGLATHDQDDDGKEADVTYISDKQKSTIVDLMSAKDVKEVAFCKFMEVESLDKIKECDFNKAVVALRAKKTEKDVK